jgi:hypothetical protein
MKAILFSLALLGIPGMSLAGEPLPGELVKKLTVAVRDTCPDAQIQVSNNVFTAKYGTMLFTLHNKSKTGEVYPQTYPTEGPNFRGFILTVSLENGPYEGAAVIPQTLQGPYFPTFIDGPAAEDGRKHYWVTFSYGSRLDEKTRSAIFEAIPKTKFQGNGRGTADR